MRHYEIYLLKPEVASSYLGNESLIFQLFHEGETAEGELQAIVQKQIQFIVRTIPSIQIQKSLEESLKKRNDFYQISEHFYIDMKTTGSKAILKDHGHMITISASGTYQAETIFFEVLRKLDACFFAIDFERRNYGWLNPIKQVNYV